MLGSKRTSDILHFTAALNYIGTSAAGCDLRARARARRAYIFEFNHERVIRRASGGEANAWGGRLTRQKGAGAGVPPGDNGLQESGLLLPFQETSGLHPR